MKIFLSLLICVAVGFSSIVFANVKESQDMTTIKQEMVELKDNLKEYSQAKKDELTDKMSHLVDQTQNRYSQLSEEGKRRLQGVYDQSLQAYEDTKKATEDKQAELYNKAVAELEKLNDKIEAEINKSKKS